MFLVKLDYSIEVYISGTLPWAFSLESQRSCFDGFSKTAIIYEILANNWQIIHKKCKAVVCRCFSK